MVPQPGERDISLPARLGEESVGMGAIRENITNFFSRESPVEFVKQDGLDPIAKCGDVGIPVDGYTPRSAQ
ncbi:hypothetical protein TSO5_30945 [Azospirillum sp. TSO5]|nr:hypothetical protein TSO5_30945 [Azospirillum sp. TSO5]